MTFLSQFDALHEQATKAAGLDDFGPADYIVPMKLLLSDYDNGNRFNPLGEQMICGAMVGLLVSRLIARQGFKTHLEFTHASIKKPIIILGMPRTGSTALHRLLVKDPGTQCLTPWLGNTPMPRPPKETWEDNPWFQMTAQGLEQFYQICPALKPMHPMLPGEADECRYGMEPSFWSPGFAFFGASGEYAEWVINADARYAYEYYKKVLGLIAGGDTRRWILKDPTTHIWAPQAALDAFPDALFVYTHRDPVTAMASLSDMMYTVRGMREPGLTSEQNGREQLALWGQAIEKTEEVLNQLSPSRIFNVHINELQADLAGTAERIYRYFELPVSDEAHQCWQQHARMDARSGHGAHHYKTESTGFNSNDVKAAIGRYCEKYRKLYGTAA